MVAIRLASWLRLGAAQAFDLLGEVVPVQRQIAAHMRRVMQRTSLLSGPAQEILIVKRLVHHRLALSSYSTGQTGRAREAYRKARP